MEIARYLIKKGERVAIVSRGYGGKLPNKNVNVISDGENTFYTAAMAGDEPFMLAQKAQGVCVLTCKNRYKAAKFAVEKLGVTKIILDDGFQHRKFHRDLDIVLMDSKMGLCNEKLLPAGPLREGAEALERIDKLVVVSKNTDHSKAEKFAKIMQKRLSIETQLCYTEPDYIYNIKTGELLDEGETVTAICAIGQPQQFFDFLGPYSVKDTIALDDHHQYSPIDLVDIEGNIVTTEKDAVKLLRFDKDNIYALKLRTTIDVERLLDVKKG
ncbi:tetraacyldisaccharide 4'-kinase [bacterium]|nr:tetraacyldisaccharide 4'-kinase [bacterium]